MGNRNSSNKIYSIPSFYSIKHIHKAYMQASADTKNIMEMIVPLKTNFRVHVSGEGLFAIWLNHNEAMTVNSAPLLVILKSSCEFEDISLLQFKLTDQELF